MLDNQFKLGILAGAIGVLVLGVSLSGGLSNAEPDTGHSSKADGDYSSSDSAVYRNQRHSGDRTEFDLDLESFRRIDIKGVMELQVTAGQDQKIHVEMAEDATSKIEFYVKDGTFHVEMEEGDHDDLDMEVTISVKQMDAFILRGAVDAKFENIDSQEFDLDLRGAGNVILNGRCDTVNINLKGAGNVEADDLKCKTANVQARGAGNVEAYASDTANIDLRGIGNVEIYGSPKDVDKTVRGIGSIDIR